MIRSLLNKRREEFQQEGGFSETLSTEQIAARQGQLEAEGVPTCPQCGARMVVKKRGRGEGHGQPFWGCPQFPACRGTRPYDFRGNSTKGPEG
ncbi:MAG: topoisomerase DNA-binding C4 zinc finger domain-containing protein [Bacteroidales bacterium]|nr:topoisomerase DNA-binding C4 zinc finger domain-containing protein [Bacteroidales bacterium]